MTVWSAIGTISGTSADGIDIAEIGTDAETVKRFGPAGTSPYATKTRDAVLQAIARGPSDRSDWPLISQAVTEDHAHAIGVFLRQHKLAPHFIVFHGQTVWHDPDKGQTVQLGDPKKLASMLSLPVISDVRQADLRAGGQGAPVVPVYHRALLKSVDLPGGYTADRPMCFLNIGGVSNLTFLSGDKILSFDIGPGNALLDDWLRQKGVASFDEDGQWSARGDVHDDRVRAALGHPFFELPGPKSLDRNAFSLELVRGLSVEDGASTLAAITTASIAASVALLPEPPVLWVVCGGGRKNKTIMAGLRKALGVDVIDADDCKIDGDAIEAQAMAFLGARNRAGLPTTYPETTGAHGPVVGGEIYLPGL
ncbi:anhydro-N-acetylmuramic acid kinase [Roseibium hamelinense]|uniref:Anhydro-N-acetylmuramic acid kinase n=1 Tax=Roseibium hamelinense TaxID=150831 RepID=A0A562T3C2_9HYPH|nr:anhydro-N-acetylmuramic acid kinase [Roseibium hamelinense]MTI44488.1 anhydro-N-acetylmuramic acid kinase [Roseibium hamelinense]TWI87456.1 anhydro-N-acetylmuramic acid kinase [Roseibium hamelinense]